MRPRGNFCASSEMCWVTEEPRRPSVGIMPGTDRIGADAELPYSLAAAVVTAMTPPCAAEYTLMASAALSPASRDL